MQHYKPFEQPWYVRSIDNNPPHNDSHFVGGGKGLESAINNDVSITNSHAPHPSYAARIVNKILSAMPAPVGRIVLIGSLIGSLGLEVACGNQATSPSSTPPTTKQEQTTTQTPTITIDNYKVIFPYKEPSSSLEEKVYNKTDVATYMKFVRMEEDVKWAISLADLVNKSWSPSEWKDFFEKNKELGKLIPYIPIEDIEKYQQSQPNYQGTLNVDLFGKPIVFKPQYFQETATGELILLQNPDIDKQKFEELKTPKVAIYPWVPLKEAGKYGGFESIPNNPYWESMHLFEHLGIDYTGLDFRKEHSLDELKKFDVILFNTTAYATYGKEDAPIPGDIIQQYVFNGGNLYVLMDWVGSLYQLRPTWEPTELEFKLSYATSSNLPRPKGKIFEPLHPIFSKIISFNMELVPYPTSVSAIDHSKKWTYLIADSSGMTPLLMEMHYGKGTYVISVSYWNHHFDRVPVLDVLVEETLSYLMSNEGFISSKEEQTASYQRSIAGRLTAQIEEVRNNPKLTNDQKESEIRKLIEAVKRGSQYSGSLQDKTIETLIEYATPDADENTRIIQRNAVKWIFETDNTKAEQHWDTIEDTIQKMFGD